MIINRRWAMPNKNTFLVQPVNDLIQKYINKNGIWIDPFCNDSCFKNYCKHTNDLNSEFNTTHNLDALEFLKTFNSKSIGGILFDPPYSITQAAQCYKNYGKDKLEINVANMRYWSECKNEIMRILKKNGICISFGWNSNGTGIQRGFKIIEILLVAHGGSKNDTIITVSKKIQSELFD